MQNALCMIETAPTTEHASRSVCFWRRKGNPNSLKPHQALLVGGGRQVSDTLAIHAVAIVLVIVPALRGEVLLVQLHSRTANSLPAVALLQPSSSSSLPFDKLPA